MHKKKQSLLRYLRKELREYKKLPKLYNKNRLLEDNPLRKKISRYTYLSDDQDEFEKMKESEK